MPGFARLTLPKPLKGLRNEAGGHRIQRIPPTERRGRVHTSTLTVSILDGAAPAPAEIRESDLHVRWFSGSGSGGQHRNKHQNCVELTHVPTGIRRSAQTRSRETSMKEARAALDEAVLRQASGQAHDAVNRIRADQIGLGMRGDKRRTYRFRDDHVSDDVTGRSTTCRNAMKGRIDLLWPENERPNA